MFEIANMLSSGASVAARRFASSCADKPRRFLAVRIRSATMSLIVATLYQMNHRRTGPRSYKVGKYRRYSRDEVLAWLSTCSSDQGGE